MINGIMTLSGAWHKLRDDPRGVGRKVVGRGAIGVAHLVGVVLVADRLAPGGGDVVASQLQRRELGVGQRGAGLGRGAQQRAAGVEAIARRGRVGAIRARAGAEVVDQRIAIRIEQVPTLGVRAHRLGELLHSLIGAPKQVGLVGQRVEHHDLVVAGPIELALVGVPVVAFEALVGAGRHQRQAPAGNGHAVDQLDAARRHEDPDRLPVAVAKRVARRAACQVGLKRQQVGSLQHAAVADPGVVAGAQFRGIAGFDQEGIGAVKRTECVAQHGQAALRVDALRGVRVAEIHPPERSAEQRRGRGGDQHLEQREARSPRVRQCRTRGSLRRAHSNRQRERNAGQSDRRRTAYDAHP